MRNGLIIFFTLLCLTKTGLSQVSLVFPENNVVLNKPSSVKLTWNSLSNVEYYKLEVSNYEDFSNVLYSNIDTLDFFIINIDTTKNSKYFWRVKTNNTDWSSTYNFTSFSPSFLDSMLVWFKADEGVVSSNNFVSEWKNFATNNNAKQFNSTSTPLLTPNIALLNNKPAIRFDGTDDYLNLNSISNNRSVYILSIFTKPTFNYQPILGDPSASDFHGSADSTLFTTIYMPSPTKISNASIYQNSISINPQLLKKPFKYSLNSIFAAGNLTFGYIGKDRHYSDRNWGGDYVEILTYSNINEYSRNNIEGYLFNKYAPPVNLGKDTVANVSSFCDYITLNAKNNYVSYLWNTGDTTSSVTVTANNKYTIETKDVFGRTSYDTINVFPYIRFNNNIRYLCINDTLEIDTHLPNSYSFLWSNGSTNSKIKVYSPGQYSVIISDLNGCIVYDTINIVSVIDSVYSELYPIIPKNITICSGEKLYPKSPNSFDKFLWSTGQTSNYASFNTNGQYYLTSYSKLGCMHKDTVNVIIAGQAPTAKFGNTTLCEDAATIFTDSSTAVAGSTITNWLWTFGDGNSSVANTPINVYANSGTYTVGFKVTTNQGCADSISKTIVVNKRPTASFYNLLSCSGLPTTFVDQSSANAASNINWAWKFDNLGSVVGIKNPTFQFPAAGSYDVQLTVTNSNNCRDSITLPIAVNASPSANFAFDSACGTSPIHFQYLATVVPPATLTSWQWDFGDGTFQSAIKNAEHEYAGPGTYQVKLTVHSSDQCSNTVEKSVKVFDFPTVDFNISPTQCVGKNIQFTDISTTPDGTPMTQWNWYFSGQSTSTQQHPTYAFNQAGNYTIQLTAKNAVGCAGTKLRSIAVSEPPVPQFTFSPQNGLPPLVVNFINQTATSSNFIWDFGDGSSHYNGQNPPPHTYSTLGSYPIKLTATDFRGCSDSVVKYILVDKAVVDAVMTGITLIPSGENHKVQITLVNNSNVEIRNLGLALQTGSGALVVENWEGSLLPGGTLTYNFTGQVKLSDADIPIVCAIIDNVNNYTTESRTDNNTTCKETSVGSFDVLTMFPNPATESINFGVMLPKSGTVQIRFVDILGQILYNKDFSGVKGYNTLSMSTMPLNAAVYVAEIMYDGQTIRKKFMRKDKP